MSTAHTIFNRIHLLANSALKVCDPQNAASNMLSMIINGALEGTRLPELTPAQEHADEMVELVRMAAGQPGDFTQPAKALLDKIDPPKPVTLEEAIAALHGLADHAIPTDAAIGKARALLRRVNAAK